MPKLSLIKRPAVLFNPEDRDHRRWFGEFKRHGTWGSCPVVFEVSESGDLITVMQNQLIDYYTAKEFG